MVDGNAMNRVIDEIKYAVRENMSPYFEESEIEYFLEKNGGDVDATIYELLTIKAEDSTLSVSGLSTSDTSAYFRRLASKYRRYNSGVLG